jgi:hypothetical protein
VAAVDRDPHLAIRAVLDTSVLVPARLREELQSLAQDGAFTAIWSPWIIAELYRTLTWRWIAHPAVRVTTAGGNVVTACDISPANWARCGQQAKRMMQILLSTPNWQLVDPRPPYPPAWETLDDVWDEPIWAAAVIGQVQYVVSDNTHDFPPCEVDGRHIYEGIEYINGTDFIALVS